MADRQLPTPAELRQLLRYEPETGKLFWRERAESAFSSLRACRSWNGRYAGREAFTADNGDGYRHGCINYVKAFAHRVAWCLHYGVWPDNELDHADLDRANNRISNLRDANRSQNGSNVPMHRDNQTGMKGVYFHRRNRNWVASIMRGRAKISLGSYGCPTAAHLAYCRASARHHHEFGRTSS